MNISRNQIVIGFIVLIIIVSALIFYFGRRPAPPPQIKLTIWGIEPRNDFEQLIRNYIALRPNVQIIYEQVDENNYSQKILEGLASEYGPDIFMIKSKSLFKDISKLSPVLNTQFNLSQLRSIFPQVVEDDFVYDGQIYALPLSIDSLALFYNQDYFNKAQIIYPPKTWDDFVNYVQKLKVLDLNESIIQAGVALGRNERSILHATDILKLLMKQAGISIFNNKEYDFGQRGKYALGSKILDFYLSFADPQNSNYTWPANFENSLDAFASGKVAMIFAYQKDVKSILEKNPYLNFRIAPVPQFKDSKINYAYADYWGLAVSKKSRVSAWAWDFVIYATTNDTINSSYLLQTKKPPATKSQISKYLSDPDLGVFTSQTLISRSWQEPNMEKVNQILNNIINDVLSHKFNSSEAIRLAEEQANQLVRNY